MKASSSLGTRTASSILWMVFGSGGQTIFQFFLFIFLAHQLGPEAFGVVGIASVFIEISNVIGRAGLPEVLIQQRELSEEDASTAFWTSFVFGLLLMVITFLGADPLAQLFASSQVRPVMQLFAPVCLLFAVGVVFEVRLRRSFGFRAMAARNVTSTVVSGVVAMVMAVAGYGAYSLVAQRLVYVTWMLAAMMVATRWLPSFEYNWRVGVRQIAGGWFLAASVLLSTGTLRTIDLIVGYVLGPTALGILRIALRTLDMLLELSVRQIAAVTLTSLSQLQDNRRGLVAAYLRIVQMTALFVYPIFAITAVVAPELVRVMLGSRWIASVEPLQILTVTSLLIPLTYFKSNVLIAVGEMRPVLVLNLLEFVVSALATFALTWFGLNGAAASNVVRLALITPVIFLVLQKRAGVPIGRTLGAATAPGAATAVVFLMLTGLRYLLAGLPPVALILSLGSAGIATYVGTIWVIRRSVLLDAWRFLLPIVSRLRKAPVSVS